MNISMSISLILITIYAIHLKVLIVPNITIKQILKDSYQYYKEVFQIAMILYLDTICFNALAIIASTLGSLYLASHTILITFYSLCCTFTFAL
jgi:Na+-driven multidrug efflux pump